MSLQTHQNSRPQQQGQSNPGVEPS